MQLLPRWQVKGLIQALLGAVPGGEHVNDALQKTVGGMRKLEQNLATKVGDWGLMMSYLHESEIDGVQGWTMLEIGSGWYPVFPICFVLAGAQRVITVDLNRHLDEKLTVRMVALLEGHLAEIAEHSRQPLNEITERWRQLTQHAQCDELLKAARIEYRAPADARRLPWIDSNSLHLIFSNSVLEHVPAEVIAGILAESKRILRDDGVIAHEIACNDHYAHFDSNISFVNYLRYTDSDWRFWNNSLQYQNRLRAPDFLSLVTAGGFQVIKEARHTANGVAEALSEMKLAPEFNQYSREDLKATTLDLVARKADRSFHA